MTVKELKTVLDEMEPDLKVGICVNTPGGWVCPDGCVVGVKLATRGIDWHGWEVLLVPEHKLDIHDVEEWAHPRKEDTSDKQEDTSDKQEEKKEVFCNGMTAGEYIKLIEDAHEASKGSQLVFK